MGYTRGLIATGETIAAMMPRTSLTVALMLLSAACSSQNAQTPSAPPLRVTQEEGLKHQVTTVPAAPVTTVYANTVWADLIVELDGHVSSVSVVEGNPAHTSSATEAFKGWKFAPFIQNGKPVRVVVKSGIHVPDELPSPEALQSGVARALGDECSALVNARNGAEAQVVCAKVLAEAEKLPAHAILERSGAHAWMGHAFLIQDRPRDALKEYLEELSVGEKVLKANDAELASAYRHLAVAHFALEDRAAADRNLARAVAIMEAAIVNLPSEREGYVARLREMMLEQAVVKRGLGDETAAVALEAKARP